MMRILSMVLLSLAAILSVSCADEEAALPRYSQVYDANHDPQGT